MQRMCFRYSQIHRLLQCYLANFSFSTVPQQQRLGMRVAGIQGVAGRVVSVNHMIGPRMPLAPPPPPPPYPGPPPPYPGPIQVSTLFYDRPTSLRNLCIAFDPVFFNIRLYLNKLILIITIIICDS